MESIAIYISIIATIISVAILIVNYLQHRFDKQKFEIEMLDRVFDTHSQILRDYMKEVSDAMKIKSEDDKRLFEKYVDNLWKQ